MNAPPPPIKAPLSHHDGAHLLVLMEGVTQGDRESFAKLHHLTSRELRALAESIARSSMDAEEIVCDVFMHAWRHAPRYDPSRGTVIAWLRVIVRRRAIDVLRKRRNLWSLEHEDIRRAVEILACSTKGPDELASEAQAGAQIPKMLAELSSVSRKIVELAYFQHLTHEEISRVLDMPVGSVKSRIRRALLRMNTVTSPIPAAQTSTVRPALYGSKMLRPFPDAQHEVAVEIVETIDKPSKVYKLNGPRIPRHMRSGAPILPP